jgi:MYXO-CTERM domain-containing protein
MCEIWLLRLRALLARAHGDEASYRDFRDRYRDMATEVAPVPSSTTTTLADDATTTNHDSDKTGLWGLAGLLGLLGLAGLKRRNDTDVAASAARGPGAPRV